MRDLLGHVAAADERYLKALLSASADPRLAPVWPALDRRTRALVQLAALCVSDADTDSLRCAVDQAVSAGSDEQAVVRVLVLSAAAAGRAHAADGAPRLALALDRDLDHW